MSVQIPPMTLLTTPDVQGDDVSVVVLTEESSFVLYYWSIINEHISTIITALHAGCYPSPFYSFWSTTSEYDGSTPSQAMVNARQGSYGATPAFRLDGSESPMTMAHIQRCVETLQSMGEGRSATRHLVLVTASTPAGNNETWRGIELTLNHANIRLHMILSSSQELYPLRTLYTETLHTQNRQELSAWFPADTSLLSFHFASRAISPTIATGAVAAETPAVLQEQISQIPEDSPVELSPPPPPQNQDSPNHSAQYIVVDERQVRRQNRSSPDNPGSTLVPSSILGDLREAAGYRRKRTRTVRPEESAITSATNTSGSSLLSTRTVHRSLRGLGASSPSNDTHTATTRQRGKGLGTLVGRYVPIAPASPSEPSVMRLNSSSPPSRWPHTERGLESPTSPRRSQVERVARSLHGYPPQRRLSHGERLVMTRNQNSPPLQARSTQSSPGASSTAHRALVGSLGPSVNVEVGALQSQLPLRGGDISSAASGHTAPRRPTIVPPTTGAEDQLFIVTPEFEAHANAQYEAALQSGLLQSSMTTAALSPPVLSAADSIDYFGPYQTHYVATTPPNNLAGPRSHGQASRNNSEPSARTWGRNQS